jgi:hypothetical protein
MRRDSSGGIMIDDQWHAPDAAWLRWSTASVVQAACRRISVATRSHSRQQSGFMPSLS